MQYYLKHEIQINISHFVFSNFCQNVLRVSDKKDKILIYREENLFYSIFIIFDQSIMLQDKQN